MLKNIANRGDYSNTRFVGHKGCLLG